MKTRMQPIGNAWNKLPRLVRDLSHDMGKKIELTMLGADTELDRQVLELIKDPLTHMIRNSGDHGLETPAERRAAGKPETGTIVLNAFHEGGYIILEISDDGRGLAVDRIRAKALSSGLATEAELAGMTDGQIQRFIFRAGFSTADDSLRRVRPRRRHGRGQDQYREDRRHHRAEEHPRPGHDVHRQDPADPGDRLGADRRSREGALRHPAAQRGRTGAGTARLRQQRPATAPATASSNASTTPRCCACAIACCRWSA